MNNMARWQNKSIEIYGRFFTVSKDNVFLCVGLYGLCLIVMVVILTPWIGHDKNQLYSHLRLLAPAWEKSGDLTHILGVDQQGRDIFTHLLWALRTSLIVNFWITLCVILLGSLISLLGTFVKAVSDNITIFFRVITTIPPLLMMMIVALFWGDTLINLMLVVGITMLPRFIYNVYHALRNEIDKPYITALRLDGLSSLDILWHSLIPNSWAKFITECINIYCLCLLAFTTLTFLRFGSHSLHDELGLMMRQMVAIIPFNKWGFIAPGLTIMVIILLSNLLNFGLQQFFSRRN